MVRGRGRLWDDLLVQEVGVGVRDGCDHVSGLSGGRASTRWESPRVVACLYGTRVLGVHQGCRGLSTVALQPNNHPVYKIT